MGAQVTVLSVSPIEEDHLSLQAIFAESEWAAYTTCRWTLARSTTLSSALNVLRRKITPVVICESNLQSGTWKDLLERIGRLRQPPLLIVTSRLADSRLWAEALNLGAYDVLAKPFDKKEVARIVSLAWLHWEGQRKPSAGVPALCLAASA